MYWLDIGRDKPTYITRHSPPIMEISAITTSACSNDYRARQACLLDHERRPIHMVDDRFLVHLPRIHTGPLELGALTGTSSRAATVLGDQIYYFALWLDLY